MICHHQPVYPSSFLCSALLAAGAPTPAIYLLRSLVSCVCAVQPNCTPSSYSTVHAYSSKSPLPGYCIFHVHFHACASCRPPAIHVLSVPMSRSAVTLSRRVSASERRLRQSQFPVTLLPICARCSSPCPVPVPSHPLLHVHTHTSSTLTLLLQLSILYVAESRQDDREARRCEAVNCEAAVLLALYALENPLDQTSSRSRLRPSLPCANLASHTVIIII